MKSLLCTFILLFTTASPAQQAMPQAALDAKTIAVVNDTKTNDVPNGALDQLKQWGHFTVTEDPDNADIVLRFDKKTDREEHNDQTTDPSGKPTWSGTVVFTSKVHMHAYLKGADAPFYSTGTEDSKRKAGASCVLSFEKAWLAAR